MVILFIINYLEMIVYYIYFINSFVNLIFFLIIKELMSKY